jgi:hypothetical protein
MLKLFYPYFYVDDDVKERIDNLCGSAFQVAIAIYEEKMFFRNFAPKEIKRARDDKSKTIRKMIDIAEDRRKSKVLLSFSFSLRKEDKEEDEIPWLKHLPKSLLGIYNSEVSKKSGEYSLPLGALPLRDLVKTMFEKDSALIKKFN